MMRPIRKRICRIWSKSIARPPCRSGRVEKLPV
jgi:hypothetical protein